LRGGKVYLSDPVLSFVHRTVNRDNTVSFQNLALQIERGHGEARWPAAA